MVRKVFKRTRSHEKVQGLIQKYQIPRAYIGMNRRSVSRAMLVGLFFAMMPMPFQMLAVLAVLPFFAFNAPIALVLVWVSNPLTMPFIFYAEYLTGNLLLMRGDEAATQSVEISLAWFENNLEAIVVPLYTGALFYGVVLSVTGFLLVNWLWIRSVRKERG